MLSHMDQEKSTIPANTNANQRVQAHCQSLNYMRKETKMLCVEARSFSVYRTFHSMCVKILIMCLCVVDSTKSAKNPKTPSTQPSIIPFQLI